jgi:DNA topoisomerase IB
MSMALSEASPDVGRSARQRVVAAAYREVADTLHNTPAVTRSAYVDPRVVDLWEEGRAVRPPAKPTPELVPLSASRALSRLLRAS